MTEDNSTRNKKNCFKCPDVEAMEQLKRIFGTVDNLQYEEHSE
jgi:hypothetical protein